MPDRVIICGGRNYANRKLVWSTLAMVRPTTVVQGGATGADSLAKEWALANHVSWEEFPANWAVYGNSAGPLRNQKMADAGADLCLAFPGGRGTADMIRRALNAGITVMQIHESKQGDFL